MTAKPADYFKAGYLFGAANQPVSPDKEILRVIDLRDRYHEWADKLAYAIAARLGVEIGEHSSSNLPWENALAFIESTPPEIEPVYQVCELQSEPDYWRDQSKERYEISKRNGMPTRILYTSSPSPNSRESTEHPE